MNGNDARRNRRVLVVDDEPDTTEIFARMLRLDGYDVDEALDGHAGLESMLSRTFDAVILDLQMPRIDGLEVLRRLRQIPSCHDVPVAIVTGNYMLDNASLSEIQRLHGVVRYKPLWLEDLIELTGTLIPT